MTGRWSRKICIFLNIVMVVAAAGILGLSFYGFQREDRPENSKVAEAGSGVELALETQQADSTSAALSPQSAAPPLVQSTNADVDPGACQQLAEQAAALGDFEGAIHILEEGIAGTGSEELERTLEAVRMTAQIPAYQKEWLEALYAAFSANDRKILEAALQAWATAEWQAEGNEAETLWISFDQTDFTWDGIQLHPNYSGIGLQFEGINIYYGELTNGVPDGEGICVAVNTYYPDGTVGYVLVDGQWDNGIAVGNAIVRQSDTSSNPADRGEYEFHCVFDGTADEVMGSGELLIYQPWDGIVHRFHLLIQDGYLVSDALQEDPYQGFVLPCDQHDGCGSELVVEDRMEYLCQNIYPWGRQSPYEDPHIAPILNFSYIVP